MFRVEREHIRLKGTRIVAAPCEIKDQTLFNKLTYPDYFGQNQAYVRYVPIRDLWKDLMLELTQEINIKLKREFDYSWKILEAMEQGNSDAKQHYDLMKHYGVAFPTQREYSPIKLTEQRIYLKHESICSLCGKKMIVKTIYEKHCSDSCYKLDICLQTRKKIDEDKQVSIDEAKEDRVIKKQSVEDRIKHKRWRSWKCDQDEQHK